MQDFSEIFGPAGRADYAIGDTVTFHENDTVLSGEVIYVQAAGVTVTGRHHPIVLHIDCGDGWPHVVYPSQIMVP